MRCAEGAQYRTRALRALRAAVIIVTLAVAAAPALADAQPFILRPNNPAGFAEFGKSMSISGNWLAVGAPSEPVNGGNGFGAVYLWEWDGVNWQLRQKLIADPPVNEGIFGDQVALQGDTLAVRSLDNLLGEPESPAIHIYSRDAGVWSQTAQIPSPPGRHDFAIRIALSGDFIIAGTPRDGAAGAAYVYRRDGSAWTLDARLVPGSAASGSVFGQVVDIDGTTAVIGAPADNGATAPVAGSAFVFQRTPSGWVQEAKLLADDGIMFDVFGVEVAISGDRIAVSTTVLPDIYRGDRVYIFDKLPDGWHQQAKIMSGDSFSDNSSRFGFRVCLVGPQLLASDHAHRGPAVRLYVRSSGNWAELARFAPEFGSPEEFGTYVAKVTENWIAFSNAGISSSEGTVEGKVYVYRNLPPPPVITSTYPIRGTAAPGATVILNRLATVGGTPIPLSVTTADANGDFLDPADTLPYVGQWLTATQIVGTESSAPSEPVLITDPCPAPPAPDTPFPADAATLVEPSALLLAWDDLPVKSAAPAPKAATASPGWVPAATDCAAPLDIEAFSPVEGVRLWDGESFAREGVVFSPAEGAQLYLARDEIERGFFQAYIMSTTRTTNFPANAPTIADFLRPVTCVSLDILDVDQADEEWRLAAYDANGELIAERLDPAGIGKYKLQFPGIRRVIFEPSPDYEGFYNFAFNAIDCPVTFDVAFGPSPVALAPLCTDAAAPACAAPPLATFTTYYWQVTAKSAVATVPGPIWSFTTRPATLVRNDTFVMLEDGNAATLNVLANDTNDTGPLTITSFTLPSVGQLTKNPDNTFTYLPPANFAGQVEFTYTVPAAGPGSITTATVGIVVLQSNDAPTVRFPVPDLSVAANAPNLGLNAGLIFQDPDGDLLEYTLASNSNPALVTVTRSGAGFVLAFAPNATGTATIRLRATDPGGLFAEDTFIVTVGTPPSPPIITQQPAPQTVNYLNNATFTCAATSNVALTYRWQRNGLDIADGDTYSGANTNELRVLAAVNTDEGQYRCRVYNGNIAVFTSTATLTVRDPYLLVEPADTAGGVGGTAAFQVTAVGSGTLQYQWYIGNAPLSDGDKYAGTQTGRLLIKNLIDLPLQTDEQLYRVEIQGADTAPLRSRQARLTISDPFITGHPQPLTVREGGTAVFNVTAVGTPPLLYRWRRDGVLLDDSGRFSGTRTPTLTITGALETDEADYACTVIGQEIVDSSPARLTVTQIPAILGLRITPASGIVPRGGDFTIEVLLDGPATGLSFAWEREGNALADSSRISGSATPLLSVISAEEDDAGNYTCTVTRDGESLVSPPGLVRVGLAFLNDLADTEIETGQRLTWPTTVTGAAGPVTFNWFRQTVAKAFLPLTDGPRISGTQSSALVIDPVEQADTGQYVVYAVDGTDVAVSRIAALTVAAELPLGSALGLATLAAALATLTARRRAQNLGPPRG